MAYCCLSGINTSAITYLMEYTKIKYRPKMANFLNYAIASSYILVPLAIHFLSPLHTVLWSMGNFHVCVWRLCMFLNIIPGLFAVLVMWLLPETAKFMLAIGDQQRAYETLNRLCLRNRKQSLESLGVTTVTQPHLPVVIDKKTIVLIRLWNDTMPLFKPPYMKDFLLITGIMCGYFFVGNGLSMWFTKIRHRLSNDERIVCDHMKGAEHSPSASACSTKPINYLDNIFLGVSILCVCIFITILFCFLSRRRIMFVNAVITAVSGLSLNFITNQILQLVAMVCFISMCTGSMSLASSAIADIVPTHLRGKAISLSLMFARLSVILANCIIGNFLYDYCLITFNLFLSVTIVVAILTLVLRV